MGNRPQRRKTCTRNGNRLRSASYSLNTPSNRASSSASRIVECCSRRETKRVAGPQHREQVDNHRRRGQAAWQPGGQDQRSDGHRRQGDCLAQADHGNDVRIWRGDRKSDDSIMRTRSSRAKPLGGGQLLSFRRLGMSISSFWAPKALGRRGMRGQRIVPLAGML